MSWLSFPEGHKYVGATQHIYINGQRPTFDAIPALLDLMAIESSSNTIVVTRSPIRRHMFAITLGLPRTNRHILPSLFIPLRPQIRTLLFLLSLPRFDIKTLS